jgi:hypothetical protein
MESTETFLFDVTGRSDAAYFKKGAYGVSGYTVFLQSAPIASKCVGQRFATLSSAEAQLGSAVSCVQENYSQCEFWSQWVYKSRNQCYSKWTTKVSLIGSTAGVLMVACVTSTFVMHFSAILVKKKSSKCSGLQGPKHNDWEKPRLQPENCFRMSVCS